MGKITHCNSQRKAKTYWLYPNDQKFQYEIIHVLESCPNCKQRVIEWQAINWERQWTPKHRAHWKAHQDLLIRIEADLAFTEEALRDNKNSKGAPQVSDCTREICQDTAHVYPKVLKRFCHGRQAC